MANVKIGIGSWADPEYVGLLYPKGLPPNQRLSTYATRFNHVEVNSSYYATPKLETVKGWVAQTPDDFTFDLKLHRAFSVSPEKTARKGELVKRMLTAVQPLVKSGKLGAFLLMLSADFAPGKRQLDELKVVREKFRPHRLAVELRNCDWVKPAHRESTLEFFRAQQITWVAVDMPVIKNSRLMPAIDEVTDPRLAYLRLHGRNPHYLEAKSAAEGHTYAYSPAELKEIVARIATLAKSAGEVHVVANNHAHDFAPRTALALKEMLGAKNVSRGGEKKSA